MFVQSLFINGVYELFNGKCITDIQKGKICDGNLFYKISPSFFENNRGKWWTYPIWSCVKCMSSIYSILTFFPVSIYLYGFRWEEIFIWIVDAVSLITLNYYVYKKL